MNGGQRTPSTNGLIGDLRVATTFGFLNACLDLRFLANWFFLTIFVVDKATGVFLDHEVVKANRMLGAIIYLGCFRFLPWALTRC